MLESLYYWYYGNIEIEPCPKQVRLRNVLLKQIKHSKLKLKPVKPLPVSWASIVLNGNKKVKFVL
jgi:hypothetical protein